MSSSSGSSKTTQSSAALVYLSGSLRGKTVRVSASTMCMLPETGELLAPDLVDDERGTISLYRAGDGYELVASPAHRAWVNGERVEHNNGRALRSGDLIEIERGPVMRFRIHPPGADTSKSVGEVFADSFDQARHSPWPFWLQTPRLMTGMLHGLATQTSLRFRVGAAVLIVVLGAAVTDQSLHTYDLERRLVLEQERVSGIADLLRRFEEQSLARDELSRGLVASAERIQALEAGSVAVRRVVANAEGSVVFIHGSFGFEDPTNGRPLRVSVTARGDPARSTDGSPLITMEGEGPPFDVTFAGTAFFVDHAGSLLTSRHIAIPWEGEDWLPALRELGLRPMIRRLSGFVPGSTEPFEVSFVAASDTHDIAVLRAGTAMHARAPLRLATANPVPGDAAILLGYAGGIRALMARAGDAFVKKQMDGAKIDPHGLARKLAKADLIKPLASRGIVGQVSGEAIVYDAETASGGSGGPVFNVNGEVIAINRAILPEFGGSNIGVPIAHAFVLLRHHQIRLEP